MSRSVEKVTLVQESAVTMNFRHKKFLQTLGCAIVLAYFTLLVYQTFGNADVKVQTNERQLKPFYQDRNLAEDRSQTELEVPQELTSEFATATATVKPPMTTLDDVFISVKTTKSYHTKRLPIILKTWFQLARKQTWFFTDTDDMEFQIKTNGHMINTNCSSSHSRKALCCKMSVEFDTFLNTDKKRYNNLKKRGLIKSNTIKNLDINKMEIDTSSSEEDYMILEYIFTNLVNLVSQNERRRLCFAKILKNADGN